MKHVKTIGIIGAGLSGIIAAKTCIDYGYDVKMFEKATELGCVRSNIKRKEHNLSSGGYNSG